MDQVTESALQAIISKFVSERDIASHNAIKLLGGISGPKDSLSAIEEQIKMIAEANSYIEAVQGIYQRLSNVDNLKKSLADLTEKIEQVPQQEPLNMMLEKEVKEYYENINRKPKKKKKNGNRT